LPSFFRIFPVKPNDLPRQARDNRKENSTKQRFAQVENQPVPEVDFGLVGAGYEPPSVRNTGTFEPFFLYKNDHFAKTGSGQT
jgi:hypothetical protein